MTQQIRILITEAYSAKNLGDRELVLRTVDVVRRRHPHSRATILATDPASFIPYVRDASVERRAFDRLQFRNSSKFWLLSGWGLRVTALSIVALLAPLRLRRALTRVVGGETFRRYGDADEVVAVGGGYLGDQYAKESLVTAWTWWFASRLGVRVETMPISVEIQSAPWRKLWAQLVRGVRFAVRDTQSGRRLAALGLEAVYTPDLAFRSALSHSNPVRNDVVAVAPIGSDYLTRGELAAVTKALVDELARMKPAEVALISMHSRVDGHTMGGDRQAADLLERALQECGFTTRHLEPRDFSDLVDQLSMCRMLISARMHAGIAGLCAGIPVGLLAYEEKHHALFEDLRLANYVTSVRRPGDLPRLVGRLDVADPEAFAHAAISGREALAARYGH